MYQHILTVDHRKRARRTDRGNDNGDVVGFIPIVPGSKIEHKGMEWTLKHYLIVADNKEDYGLIYALISNPSDDFLVQSDMEIWAFPPMLSFPFTLVE